MASYETFYPANGEKYPFEQPYGGFIGKNAYHANVRDIAYPTDPLTANQLKKVSDKISTGAQTIEVSGLGLTGAGPMKHLASIPKQHWKEIDRLRKLTGVDLTFHGPLVESTGFNRGNWSEDQRVEAEKQMKAAVELAQQMNSEDKQKGIVMTFHSNNGLPEVERRVKIGVKKDGSPDEKVVSMSVYNERTGEIGSLPFTARTDHFDDKEESVRDRLDKFNTERWTGQIESVFVNSTRANNELFEAFSQEKEISKEMKEQGREFKGLMDTYKVYQKNYDEYRKALVDIDKEAPGVANVINSNMNKIHNANFFVTESYNQMKELFNVAYVDALRRKQDGENEKEKKDAEMAIKRLEEYKKELKSTYADYDKNSNVVDFKKKIEEGTKLLGEDGVRPQIYRPLKNFAIDKSSDTFSNVAIHAWRNAKENNLAPGIISIENPPAGMSGLTRADELAALIKKSREKFVRTATKPKDQGGLGMKESEAIKTADQMIGATWDVGHINSIQKWGYNRKDVLREAQTISKYVKHMHIADNLGFEDAELPIGMGNVPIDEILNADWADNFRKAKKAIETGDWFSRQGGLGMTKTPVTESLSGLTSPVYSSGPSMDGSAYWNDAVNPSGAYFGGLGPINPETHHSIYGGGYSGLPAYLGGELPGKSPNSSFSGAPLD